MGAINQEYLNALASTNERVVPPIRSKPRALQAAIQPLSPTESSAYAPGFHSEVFHSPLTTSSKAQAQRFCMEKKQVVKKLLKSPQRLFGKMAAR